MFLKKKLPINKDILKTASQACINSYNGRWGDEDNKLFDWQKVFYDKKTPRWYIGYKEIQNTMYVVFQGTTNNKGWENNFDYQQIPTPDKKGYYHKGFYRDEVRDVFEKILIEIGSFFDTKIGKNKKSIHIVITGHSKGASNSILFAKELAESHKAAPYNYIASIKCVALAAARVMSPKAAKAYKKLNIPTVLFKYGNDTVTRVPFVVCPGLIKRKKNFLWMNYWPTIQLWKQPVKLTYLGRSWYIWLMHRIPILRNIGNPLDHRPQLYNDAIKKL